ncbi:MAG TPA: 2-dehydropantoate 2-reductase [Candidatus Limnocylindrales bacterium]|nr:2-dehydropantoate 2-reductase [Candidatus Limnocylindrales bacterium]
MRIAVYGAGAVGGYLGAKLADGGSDVTLIARGAHLEALRRDGLTLVTPTGERTTTAVQAVEEPAEVGPVDVVLFLVKSYDTDEGARRLAPLIGPDTAVVSLQNGVDNEDRIAAVVGRERGLGGAAYILVSVVEPGVIRVGRAPRIVIGELDPGPPSDRVITLVEAMRAGGIDAHADDDVRRVKWEKYVLLVAFSAVTAATQLTIGDVRASAAATAMLRAVMTEAWQVGRALGVPLGDDLVDRQHAMVLAQKDTEATSLRHDLVTGHRMELEALQGTLCHLGRETGIPTPWTDAAYAILEPWAIRNAANVIAGTIASRR